MRWPRLLSHFRHAPVRLFSPVENADERDERIEFVEAFEGQDGDVHGVNSGFA
jgi:hypothetical protein